MKWTRIAALIGLVTWDTGAARGQGIGETPTYQRIRAAIDAIPAVDTHDHLWPFDRLPGADGDGPGPGHDALRPLARQLLLADPPADAATPP
jgi:hypothetical protein